MLEAASQAPDASAKVRQNLALAHALAGDWTAAKAIAATDLPPDAVTARLADWSRIATAEPKARVAMLLGPAPAAGVAPPPGTQVTVHRAVPPTIVIVPRPVQPRAALKTPKPMTIALTMPAAPSPARMGRPAGRLPVRRRGRRRLDTDARPRAAEGTSSRRASPRTACCACRWRTTRTACRRNGCA